MVSRPAITRTIALYQQADQIRQSLATAAAAAAAATTATAPADSAGAADQPEQLSQAALESEVEVFLRSPEILVLEQANWTVSSTLRKIITAPLTGNYTISLLGVGASDASLLRYYVSELVAACPAASGLECVPRSRWARVEPPGAPVLADDAEVGTAATEQIGEDEIAEVCATYFVL